MNTRLEIVILEKINYRYRRNIGWEIGIELQPLKSGNIKKKDYISHMPLEIYVTCLKWLKCFIQN